MITRRGFVFVSIILSLGVSRADAGDKSAQDFLTEIYSAYKGQNTKGVALDSHRALARTFTPALVKLIEADAKAAKKRGDVPSLDGDPFIDAQDWEIADFAIDVKDVAPNKALGTVTFKNAGEDKTIALDLVKLKDGWRIDEIRAPSGSLRALFKKK